LSNAQLDFEQMMDRFSHCLRSPLTSIRGAASVLNQTDLDLDEDSKKELTSIINDEAERLSKTIDKLLWLVRIQTNKVSIYCEKTNLLKLITETIEKLNQLLKEDLSNRINLSVESTIWATIDKELIKLVLFYLIENAVVYSPGNSKVSIVVREEINKIQISIIDQGCGIALDKQEEIFSPLYRPTQQLDRLPKVGMSLAICRGLMAAHKGAISLKSQLNEGTTVNIELPN